MPHSRLILALAIAAACTTSPLGAQVQLRPGFGIGTTVVMGDLASPGTGGVAGHVFVMLRGEHRRHALGLEGVYHRATLDSLFVPGTEAIEGRSVNGHAWSALGGMIRYEYHIIGGLHAVGGAGLLYRKVVAPDDAPTPQVLRSHDFTAQAGLAYRGPAGLAIEARLVNIFTVNDSERFIPITMGVRF